MKRKAGWARGQSLVLVFGVIIVASSVLVGLYSMLKTRTDDLAAISDRIIAQYLCEAGISAALLDIKNGRVGVDAGQWMARIFTFPVGARSYEIQYVVTKDQGNWDIVASVDSPTGQGLRYSLRVGGSRAYPIQILGLGSTTITGGL
ncbi:MAG: hypothetical protein HY078_02935 [Elusimicrobia bacterium]|nr:hypothetical protein [Elusimicrobiota bacterium]